MPGQLQEGFCCVVTNRFDQLFDDEDDPFEVLKQAEKKKMDATAPGAAKTAAQATKQPKKESQKEKKSQVSEKEETQAPVPLKKDGVKKMGRRPEQQGPTGFQQQGGQGEGRPPADRRPDRRPPRERRFDKPADEKPAEGGEFSVDKSVSDRPFRGRGGVRGGRGGRGRGVGRTDGFDSRGKREFDRHSGSDRSSLKAEEKRGGSGSHNWGTVKDELSELDQSNVTEDTPEGEEHPPNDSENKENEVEDAKEEGPKEMTLDEWKAQQNKERAKVEFNIRKANEGADWNKGYVLHKSKADDSSADDASGDHQSRKPANDITSQLEINFGDLGRPGRGRGGPRGGRGGRGAPATRPPRERRPDKAGGVSVPNVDDPEAFPALA
ncbi:plasminogen activator inhibitor 1 RNA-binding protein-like isoform X1 [Carassius auratus]|uniref:Plasminogen activator inhibitor 1 RNA-binding protein-like isoform X1 n=1 Tax=Carassius auratus TaxID=7957 RepID=A0A6P6KBJ5_CARAU|nr:plasminogen activator inhibitor 1 RNA-binding protein-like isoform X1 [Carassius auratus]XP_052455678.1 plasminogen activator inhibitor 1 RNA-binding protein-like isoform X1 [Carassius gibelio]